LRLVGRRATCREAVIITPALRRRACSRSTVVSFLHRYGGHRDLHSFPTRRSSDLVPYGSEVLARVETQMSTEGWPGGPDMPLSGFGVEPGRSEAKYISRPSRLIEGFWSLYVLLTSKTN